MLYTIQITKIKKVGPFGYHRSKSKIFLIFAFINEFFSYFYFLDQKQSVLVLPNIHINAKNCSKIAIFHVDFKKKQSNKQNEELLIDFSTYLFTA
jgi:hypothetical protein